MQSFDPAMHLFKKALDYNHIVDGIYIGTNQCCQTHFDEVLLREGIVADISLEEERVDAPFGVTFFVWIPVRDHMPPTPDQFELGVSALERIIAMGKRVYVHCKNGHGRAPTLVVAYLVKKGKSPEEAFAFIRTKRPSVHLHEPQRAALQQFMRQGA